MKLREKFKEKVQNRKEAQDAKAKAYLSKYLESCADKLPGEIEKYRKKGKTNMEHVITIGSLDYDMKTLSGYGRLHQVCAAANVQIKNEYRRYSGGGPLTTPSIVIVLNKPYNIMSSAVQLPLPGL